MEYFGIELSDLAHAAGLGFAYRSSTYNPRKGKLRQFVIYLAKAYIRREIERHLHYSAADIQKRMDLGLELESY